MGLLRSVKRRQGGLKSSGNVLPTTALGLLVFRGIIPVTQMKCTDWLMKKMKIIIEQNSD